MATKRIEATIPFTYLIPETTPEEKIYYYFKQTHRSQYIGQGKIVWCDYEGAVRLARAFFDRPNTDAVDVEFDGQYYKNVPLNGHELGERVNDEISFENYPFFIGLDEQEVYGIVDTQTEVFHTLGFPALPSQVVHISFASDPESTASIVFMFAHFVENNNIASSRTRTLMPGASVEAIVLKGDDYNLTIDALGRVSSSSGYETKVSGNVRMTNTGNLYLDEGTEGTITVLGVRT